MSEVIAWRTALCSVSQNTFTMFQRSCFNPPQINDPISCQHHNLTNYKLSSQKPFKSLCSHRKCITACVVLHLMSSTCPTSPNQSEAKSKPCFIPLPKCYLQTNLHVHHDIYCGFLSLFSILVLSCCPLPSPSSPPPLLLPLHSQS